MQTAVIYARYSSENQTEQSIEGQLRVCTEYAKTHDILILDTYIDRAMTGTNDNRPDFQRMIKDSAKREWNFVLVYKIDRFSRNKFEMATHKKTLKDHGTRVLSATEFIPDSPEGIILESMLEGYAEYYSAELSQKVRRGMNETRLKGNYTGGRILFGYKVINHKVQIDEDSAEVIRYIYEQYATGVYVKDIIAELHKRGISYYGKPFGRSTVYNILKNEKYAGIYRFNGQLFENMYPQIVPNDIFEKVRAKIQKNQYGKRSVQVVYLLRHKMKCGYCGESMIAESGISQNGDKKFYYKCYGRKHGHGCHKSVIRKEVLEDMVLEMTMQQLKKPHIMNFIVQKLMEEQERASQGSTVLKLLLKEKRQTDSALENIMRAIEQGIMNNTTNRRMKELESKQEELERQILIERSKMSTKKTEREIRKFYQEALKLEPQLLIDIIVKEIIVFDDHIDIIYNSPIMKTDSPDESQGFSFYRGIVHRTFKDPHKADITRITLEVIMRV